MKRLIRLSILFIFCLSACTGTDYTPKRTGYFRIDLPKREYNTYNTDAPFTFDYPIYASVLPDTGAGPYWLNIIFPRFKCNVYMSYLVVNGNLGAYVDECRKFVVEHEVKASAINEQDVMNKKANIYGAIYDIEGNAASNMQFYLTDSVHNFVRGALYFYAVPNKDSLQPVVDFVKQDIKHLIESFRWKNPTNTSLIKP